MRDEFNNLFITHKKKNEVLSDKLYTINNRNSFYDEKLENLVLIFHHINRTGGVGINELLLRSEELAKKKLIISTPTQNLSKEFWQNYKPPYIISSHSSYGIHKILTSKSKYFGLLRDPRRLILTKLLPNFEDFSEKNNLNNIWKKLELRIDQIKEKIGHCNLLIYEHAKFFCEKQDNKNSVLDFAWPLERKLGYLPKEELRLYSKESLSPNKLINTDPNELFRKANKKLKELFFFVGITELYEESIFLLFDIIGIEKTYLWRPGTPTLKRPVYDEIPIKCQNKINKLIEADMQFYSDQRIKLERMLGIADFGTELTKYKHDSKNPYNKILLELLSRKNILIQNFDRKSKFIKNEFRHYENFIANLKLLKAKFSDLITNPDLIKPKVNKNKFNLLISNLIIFLKKKALSVILFLNLLKSFSIKVFQFLFYMIVKNIKKIIKFNYSPTQPKFKTLKRIFNQYK